MRILLILIFLCSTANAALTPNKLPKTKTGGSSPTLQDSQILDDGTNVGIGTTAPVKRLDIKSSGTDDGIQVLSSTNSAIIQLKEQSTTSGRFLLGSSTTQSDCISSGDCNWKNSGDFIYSPSSTERFRVTSTGNVGIGTTSPAANLQISGSANTVHLIVKSSASQSAPFNDVEFQSSSGVARLKFYDLNNSPRIMYDYSGSNGGDFTGQLNGVDQMSFGFNNAGSFGGSAGVASGRLIYFYDRVSDAYRGAINASGDFYWGTTTSAFSVKLTAPASGSIPIVVRGSAGQTANLQEWQNSSGTVLSAFNPNGNVGIGTSVPTAKLVVGNNGHILSQASSSPTLSSCGTSPSVTTGSTDSVGEITVGTGTITSCTLTFVTAFDRAPHCFIQGNTTSNKTYAVTNTTTTMVISSGSAFDTEVIDYLCIGN